MLDTHRVRTRIKEIRKRLAILDKDFRNIPEKEFIKDERANAAAERHLQVAIQACIDIANHIVASLGIERPMKDTAEVFSSLAQEDVIPKEFVETMTKITGYRNVLVHDYLEIDRLITYENIQKRLPDLSKFAKHIEEFLEKHDKTKKS